MNPSEIYCRLYFHHSYTFQAAILALTVHHHAVHTIKKEGVALPIYSLLYRPTTQYRPLVMLQSSLLLPLLALAVRAAPTGNADGGGACRVVWDTTVAAPSPTNTMASPVTSGRGRAINSVGRDTEMARLAQGAGYSKPDTAAVAQSASTTMGRPSKVTFAAIRTASSNKLSPTGTSTTTLTSTTTMSSKKSSSTPSADRHDGAKTQGRKNVVYFTNW